MDNAEIGGRGGPDPAFAANPGPTSIEPVEADRARPPASPTPSRQLLAILGSGALAGLLAWTVGELMRDVFQVPQELRGALERSAEQVRAQTAVNVSRGVLAFGLLGACLGSALGALGGRLRSPSSLKAVGIAAMIGLALGASAGAGSSAIVAPILEANRALAATSLLPSILAHAGIAALIGAAGGLAFGIGRGVSTRALPALLIGGLAAAAFGSALALVLGTLAFPLSGTEHLIPTSMTARLVARLALTLAAALGVALVARDHDVGRAADRPST